MKIDYFRHFCWRRVLVAPVLLLILPGVGHAQQPDPDVVSIQSWKKGEGLITEQVLNITLGPERPEYEATIQDISGRRRYNLVLRHNPATETKLEFWGVVLREILPRGDGLKENLRENLLSEGRPTPGRHSFTKGDNVGFLYPKESPNRYIDGSDFYPIGTKRIIRIENFCMIIQVNDYQFNAKNPKTLDSLNVTVEFKNVTGKAATPGASDCSYK